MGARHTPADRAEAVRDCALVTEFLAAGYPAIAKRGDTKQRSAVRAAADALRRSDTTMSRRIGTPEAPGSHFRLFGLAPDWSIAARRGEFGFKPTLPGYEIAETKTRFNAAKEVVATSVRQRLAPVKADAPIPPGHVLKGLSTLLDAQGRTLAQWVKTREGERDPLAFAEALRAAMLEVRGLAAIDAPDGAHEGDLLTVYVIPDLHLGLLAHGAECGEDYDLRIAEAMVRREVARLMSMAPASRHAVVLFLGDFFHQNDQKNATPRSGHALDVDGRWRKVYGVGARVAIGLARAVAERHAEVEVAFLPGNHDEDAAVTLAVALELFFEGHERVRVAPGAGIHWFRRFGRCLLGATHGHTMKPDRMAMMLAADRPQDWGETAFRHLFFGHIHHETAREVGPVRVESFSTPAAKDAYAAAGGYRSGRALNAVTFHAERGEVCRHRVNISGSPA